MNVIETQTFVNLVIMACEPHDTGDSSSISESEVSEEVSGYISYFIHYYSVEKKMKYSVNVSQRVREGEMPVQIGTSTVQCKVHLWNKEKPL